MADLNAYQCLICHAPVALDHMSEIRFIRQHHYQHPHTICHPCLETLAILSGEPHVGYRWVPEICWLCFEDLAPKRNIKYPFCLACYRWCQRHDLTQLLKSLRRTYSHRPSIST